MKCEISNIDERNFYRDRAGASPQVTLYTPRREDSVPWILSGDFNLTSLWFVWACPTRDTAKFGHNRHSERVALLDEPSCPLGVKSAVLTGGQSLPVFPDQQTF